MLRQLVVSYMSCYILAWYLLSSGIGKQVPIRLWTKTLGCSEAYTQVSKDNKRLYACIFQWSLQILGYIDTNFQVDIDSSKST